MSSTRGRCSNFSVCSFAGQVDHVDIPIGQNFACPKCGAQLKALPPDDTRGDSRIRVLSGIALVLLLGSSFAAFKLIGPSHTSPQIALVDPSPARLQTRPRPDSPAKPVSPAFVPATIALPMASPISPETVLFRQPDTNTTTKQSAPVPLAVTIVAVSLPQTAPGSYKRLIGNAQRLSTNFRFQPNSPNLDNRELRDLDRLVHFLISMHATGDRLILVGFADSQGSRATNLNVSWKRADAVSVLLARRGIRVGKLAAFGSDLPVADNSTGEGRDKNRRVEVFLQQNT